MGMDIYGKKPVAESGKYFRNNIWWWHPLWDFCEQNAKDIIPENNSGHFNDGWGLSASKAEQLSKRLFALIDKGAVLTYATMRRAAIERLPNKPCSLCEGSGIRKDKVGVDMKMPDKLWVDDQGNERRGWCNGCSGVGTVPPAEASYPFDEENVREFAEFLRDSGGFEIW